MASKKPSRRTTRRATPLASVVKPQPLPPIKRRSVVRKPPRGPSVRATRQAAAPRRSKTSRSASVEPLTKMSTVGPPTMSILPPAPAWPSAPALQPRTAGPSAERRAASEEQFYIPSSYGDHRIVLMVKDPWWLYAYWEIQPSAERAARGQLQPQEVAGLQSVLRVHDVTEVDFPTQPANHSFDIGLSGLATNWYIQTNAPGRSFVVELGLLTSGGRFLLLARSNRVTAPRFGPSDIIDEAWMTTDELYWKLFGASAGLGLGSSPSGWRALLPQQLFSLSRSSASLVGLGRPSAIRGFWCRVNTDLVIHGATEPRAKVLIQGQPVTVRKDGTFSLRLALPEGTQTVTVEVTSADGQHTQTVTPLVTLAWTGSLTPDATVTKERLSKQRPESRDLKTGDL